MAGFPESDLSPEDLPPHGVMKVVSWVEKRRSVLQTWLRDLHSGAVDQEEARDLGAAGQSLLQVRVGQPVLDLEDLCADHDRFPVQDADALDRRLLVAEDAVKPREAVAEVRKADVLRNAVHGTPLVDQNTGYTFLPHGVRTA